MYIYTGAIDFIKLCVHLTGTPFHRGGILSACVRATHEFACAQFSFVCARGHFNDLRNNSSVVNDGEVICGFLHTFRHLIVTHVQHRV